MNQMMLFNRKMQKQNPEFMQFVCNQEDAEIEERQATPKRLGRPETDWDRYKDQLPKQKGTRA